MQGTLGDSTEYSLGKYKAGSIVYVENIFIIIGVQKYVEVNGIKYYGGIQQKTEDRQFTHISD